MLHHYITHYEENGKHYVEAWLQLNLFGWCFCFSKRRKEVAPARELQGHEDAMIISLDGRSVLKAIQQAQS